MSDDSRTPVHRRRDAEPNGLLKSLLSLGLAPSREGLRFWEILSIFGFTIGLVIIAVYASAYASSTIVFGVLAALGAAAWLAGGVLGFIFGVPRLRAATSPTASAATTTFIPNTNLEQISDWLTKIIVGAALVQLRAIADDVNALALSIGKELGTNGAASIAGAVMVLYFAGGFMWGYLWCSLRIFREMSALTHREQAVSEREATLNATGASDP